MNPGGKGLVARHSACGECGVRLLCSWTRNGSHSPSHNFPTYEASRKLLD